MSLVQQLLMRALVAMFWDKPYREAPVRWGTALHDRFMLPHFLWADFTKVIDDLKAAGLPVELEWFVPHFEFRFPRIGSVEAAGVELELRQALEPWHVLGEEGTAGGTARYVDDSLERLQVRVRGQTGDRYVVTCNGRALPLAPDRHRRRGGLRRALPGLVAVLLPAPDHPAARAADLRHHRYLDRPFARRAAATTSTHPGGRNFETCPVNAYEAEGRRLARFERMGHTAGSAPFQAAEINPEYPFTLDLRR